MYATACCSSDKAGDGSFVPLQVMYSERFSAAGKTRCALGPPQPALPASVKRCGSAGLVQWQPRPAQFPAPSTLPSSATVLMALSPLDLLHMHMHAGAAQHIADIC